MALPATGREPDGLIFRSGDDQGCSVMRAGPMVLFSRLLLCVPYNLLYPYKKRCAAAACSLRQVCKVHRQFLCVIAASGLPKSGPAPAPGPRSLPTHAPAPIMTQELAVAASFGAIDLGASFYPPGCFLPNPTLPAEPALPLSAQPTPSSQGPVDGLACRPTLPLILPSSLPVTRGGLQSARVVLPSLCSRRRPFCTSRCVLVANFRHP